MEFREVRSYDPYSKLHTLLTTVDDYSNQASPTTKYNRDSVDCPLDSKTNSAQSITEQLGDENRK